MRILHLASEYPPQAVYGLGRYVCDLSRESAKQGHDVHVVTNSIGGPDQEVSDHGVHVHRVDYPPPPKPPGDVAPALAFNLHLQQRAHALGHDRLGRPEVVVSHDWLTALAGERLARRFDVPHVWTVHDTVIGKSFGDLDRERQRIAHIERWAGQTAALVLANSSAIAEELRSRYGVDERKLRILHCAIDPARYTVRTETERRAAFRTVLAAPDELLLTYVGRLDLEKGLDTLINAVAIARATLPRLRLAIAGDGELRKTITDHIAQLGMQSAVRLHGYLRPRALAHFYAVSDLHLCPSYYEPFGIVAAEAMASGIPVIASNTGGLRDLIPSADVGCLVAARDIQGLANAIVAYGQNPALRASVGAAGAEHVRKHFSWPVLAIRAAALYREAVAAKDPATETPESLVAAGRP